MTLDNEPSAATGVATGITVYPRQFPAAALCPGAMEVIHRLRRANFQAYLVGGGVRDLLLGRLPKDFDVSTDARPEQLRRLLPRTRIVGRRFPIVHVRTDSARTDVTTFRRAPRQGSGHTQLGARGEVRRDREYGSSLEEDALRRDFTVNALYYDPLDGGGTLLDCLDGMADLRRRQLRVIGEPTARYREDPVRMLRAVRFVASLGFQLERRSQEALRRGHQQLSLVSPARLFDELPKVLGGGSGARAWPLLRQYRLLERLLPDTHRCLDDGPSAAGAAQLVDAVLRDTDQRTQNGQRISAAFLYAALLWPVVRARQAALARRRIAAPPAQLIGEALARQHESTRMPRRFAVPIEETLQLQWGLATARADRTMTRQPSFRAALRLLELRAACDEPELGERCAWWRRVAAQEPAPPPRQHSGGRGTHRGRRGRARAHGDERGKLLRGGPGGTLRTRDRGQR